MRGDPGVPKGLWQLKMQPSYQQVGLPAKTRAGRRLALGPRLLRGREGCSPNPGRGLPSATPSLRAGLWKGQEKSQCEQGCHAKAAHTTSTGRRSRPVHTQRGQILLCKLRAVPSSQGCGPPGSFRHWLVKSWPLPTEGTAVSMKEPPYMRTPQQSTQPFAGGRGTEERTCCLAWAPGLAGAGVHGPHSCVL